MSILELYIRHYLFFFLHILKYVFCIFHSENKKPNFISYLITIKTIRECANIFFVFYLVNYKYIIFLIASLSFNIYFILLQLTNKDKLVTQKLFMHLKYVLGFVLF